MFFWNREDVPELDVVRAVQLSERADTTEPHRVQRREVWGDGVGKTAPPSASVHESA